MTPDEIERAAIEAAAKAHWNACREALGGKAWEDLWPTQQLGWVNTVKRIVETYNAAKWQANGTFSNPDGRMRQCLVAGRWHDPVAVADCTENYIHAPGPGEYSHWQPLPQPPEQKA